MLETYSVWVDGVRVASGHHAQGDARDRARRELSTSEPNSERRHMTAVVTTAGGAVERVFTYDPEYGVQEHVRKSLLD